VQVVLANVEVDYVDLVDDPVDYVVPAYVVIDRAEPENAVADCVALDYAVLNYTGYEVKATVQDSEMVDPSDLEPEAEA